MNNCPKQFGRVFIEVVGFIDGLSDASSVTQCIVRRDNLAGFWDSSHRRHWSAWMESLEQLAWSIVSFNWFNPGISQMKLTNMVVPAGVISYGSTLADAFRECLRCNVQGLPFVDSEGRIVGQFSVRKAIKQYCISHTMIKDADFLGDNLGPLALESIDAAEMLSQPVDDFILREVVTIHSDAPCVKAMALMEKHNTNFLFVVDSDIYKGIVNVQAIAKGFMQAAGL